MMFVVRRRGAAGQPEDAGHRRRSRSAPWIRLQTSKWAATLPTMDEILVEYHRNKYIYILFHVYNSLSFADYKWDYCYHIYESLL